MSRPTINVDEFGQAVGNPPHLFDVLLYLEEAVDDSRYDDDKAPTWSRTATDILRIVNGEDRDDIIKAVLADHPKEGA